MKYDSAKLAYFSNSNDIAIRMTHRLYDSARKVGAFATYSLFGQIHHLFTFAITTQKIYLMKKEQNGPFV